jgi:hypothetical protein
MSYRGRGRYGTFKNSENAGRFTGGGRGGRDGPGGRGGPNKYKGRKPLNKNYISDRSDGKDGGDSSASVRLDIVH